MAASDTLARYLSTIDDVLAEGKRAEARHDRFRSAHPLPERAESLPPEHARLLALYQQLYDEHLITPISSDASPASARATAPRALASRHRL
jgi:hypothetical protein